MANGINSEALGPAFASGAPKISDVLGAILPFIGDVASNTGQLLGGAALEPTNPFGQEALSMLQGGGGGLAPAPQGQDILGPSTPTNQLLTALLGQNAPGAGGGEASATGLNIPGLVNFPGAPPDAPQVSPPDFSSARAELQAGAPTPVTEPGFAENLARFLGAAAGGAQRGLSTGGIRGTFGGTGAVWGGAGAGGARAIASIESEARHRQALFSQQASQHHRALAALSTQEALAGTRTEIQNATFSQRRELSEYNRDLAIFKATLPKVEAGPIIGTSQITWIDNQGGVHQEIRTIDQTLAEVGALILKMKIRKAGGPQNVLIGDNEIDLSELHPVTEEAVKLAINLFGNETKLKEFEEAYCPDGETDLSTILQVGGIVELISTIAAALMHFPDVSVGGF